MIPTLNAAAALPATLDALLEAPFPQELVVADGGSRDATAEIAEAAGAVVVQAERGRGPQLLAGAAAARGEWLLFLHADTVLSPGWSDAVADFAASPINRHRAATFRFALDDTGRAARMIETMVAWRCRLFALPYGDQGLLMARSFYHGLGGYRPLPLMEDVDIIRRIHRGRLVTLDATAVTSARRYRRDGYLLRPLRNLGCLALYYLGVPPAYIARIYG